MASSDDIMTKEVVYGEFEGKKLIGYLAHPKNVSDAPVVLVVHEWWGQTDYPRKRAEMLAKLGYVAMAVDMYGDRTVAEHPKDAQKFMMATMKNMAGAEKKFKMAMDYAKKLDKTSSEKMAAIGYCFGGGVVLHAARQGFDLDAVASFHGSLATQTPAKKGVIKAKVAVFNGAADPMVKDEDIKNLKAEMEKADATLKFVNYPGAKHGFTNPEATKKGKAFDLPLAYQEEADKKSWEQLQTFLKKAF
ncbi:dienelactone hydrolase family protein [Pseudobacteriovorax antillogorgiicola]